MIPKIIHYCWFGGKQKPALANKCIQSWSKYCPDYQIIEWNESNFDIASAPLYVRQAYDAKKWAFVTDYIRLWVVYHHGGIYLDTDVELVQSLDSLLNYRAYFGFEYSGYMNTGLGFGAIKHLPILQEMMCDYETIPFILEDGTLDLTSCPIKNTPILLRKGLVMENTLQVLENDIFVFPTAYFCPAFDSLSLPQITDKTISVHWFSGSWLPKEELRKKREQQRKQKFYVYHQNFIHDLLHIPNRLAFFFLGQTRYDKLKRLLKKPRE